MKFYLATLGCPKNAVDSEMMAEILTQADHVRVDLPGRADVLIVNTCAFVEAAREESYALLRKLASRKKSAQCLVVAGCLAQRYGQEIRRLVPQVDAVIGTQSWPKIGTLLDGLRARKGDARGSRAREALCFVDSAGDLLASLPRRATMGSTAYLKIADGCSAGCAFCAIPLIKGLQQSKPLVDVLREACELAQQGVREVVLIAQDTTAYGHERGELDALPGLLRALAQAAPELTWLRLLYAYPQHTSAQLVETMATLPQVCHYLDLPLQHGHPDVLRRMRRPSDVQKVFDLVASLRQAMPDIALRTSFIVGYPGETEQEFEGLLRFMEAISFDHVGVFAYSAEAGTPAALLPDRVPSEVVCERQERIMAAQQEISLRHNRDQVGKELDVLVEGVGEELSVGRSYREAPEIDGFVLIPGQARQGGFVRARIVAAQEYDLIAEPLVS